jgi:ERCC4-type nuclease
MPCFDGCRIFKGKAKEADVVIWPHTVLVDTREQAPFHFQGMTVEQTTTKGSFSCPLVVQTAKASLRSGDYTVRGYENVISVERKSHEDLIGTLGGGRQRFEEEMYRLNQMNFAAVVVEAYWTAIMRGIAGRKLSPQSVYGSVISFQQRYPRVHWWPCPSRRDAETTTFRILKRFVEGGGK